MLQKNLATANLGRFESEVESSSLTCAGLLRGLEAQTREKAALGREIEELLAQTRDGDSRAGVERVGRLEEDFAERKRAQRALQRDCAEHVEALAFLRRRREEGEALRREVECRKAEVFRLREALKAEGAARRRLERRAEESGRRVEEGRRKAFSELRAFEDECGAHQAKRRRRGSRLGGRAQTRSRKLRRSCARRCGVCGGDTCTTWRRSSASARTSSRGSCACRCVGACCGTSTSRSAARCSSASGSFCAKWTAKSPGWRRRSVG